MKGGLRPPGGRPVPGDVVTASAPIRVCDVGGWTDTWFSERGKVFNVAVTPLVDVRVRVCALGEVPHRVKLDVANFGDHYSFEPEEPPGRHPLLESVIDEVGVPHDLALDIRVASDVPAGCSTGTSAAVAVALIGALDALTPQPRSLDQVAQTAHRIEVERLGLQSGVQDQWCAAFGGVNFIEIVSYPNAILTPVMLHASTRQQLDQRLLLVYLGTHRSSTMHEQVIARLAGDSARGQVLEELKACAVLARDAVTQRDLEGLGRAMTRNTEAQRSLHEDLVSAQAQAVLDLAAAHGASGWKVNGAGGEGGSVSILCGADSSRRSSLELALGADPALRIIPTRLRGDGLWVWRS